MGKQPETQLWLLRARTDLPANTREDLDIDPFYPPWDKCHGMVVEAAAERQARKIANTIRGHDENPTEFKLSCCSEPNDDECLDEGVRGELIGDNEGRNVWLDPKYTTCIPLVCTGQERRVIWDVLRG